MRGPAGDWKLSRPPCGGQSVTTHEATPDAGVSGYCTVGPWTTCLHAAPRLRNVCQPSASTRHTYSSQPVSASSLWKTLRPCAPASTQASHPRPNRRDEASIVNNTIRRRRRWAEIKQDEGPADAACDQPNREKKQVGRRPPEKKSHNHHTTSHIVFCASLLAAQRRQKHKHKNWTGRAVTSTPRSSEHDNPKVVTLPWKRHQSWPASRSQSRLVVPGRRESE